MKSLQSLAVIVALFGIGFGTVGCNEIETPNGNAQREEEVLPPSDNGEVDMSSLNEKLDVLELASTQVETQIRSFSLNSFNGGQVLDRLVDAVAKAYEKIDDLRAKVNERIAKLDPLNPLHRLAIEKLNEVLEYLDELEAKLDESTARVVARVDELIEKAEREISEMDPRKPATWVAYALWREIKPELLEFQNRLLELIKI